MIQGQLCSHCNKNSGMSFHCHQNPFHCYFQRWHQRDGFQRTPKLLQVNTPKQQPQCALTCNLSFKVTIFPSLRSWACLSNSYLNGGAVTANFYKPQNMTFVQTSAYVCEVAGQGGKLGSGLLLAITQEGRETSMEYWSQIPALQPVRGQTA